MKPFHVTYETVTPESSKYGDAEELGYAMPHGWYFALDTVTDADVKACGLTLRQAVCMIDHVEDGGRWFSETSGTNDYVTGANIRRDLHPPDNITKASYQRLKRLLAAR